MGKGTIETKYQCSLDPNLSDEYKATVEDAESFYFETSAKEIKTMLKQVDKYYELILTRALDKKNANREGASFQFQDEDYSNFSRQLAQQTAKFYCNLYPESVQIYEYKDDKSLTDYVNRVFGNIEKEGKETSIIPIPISEIEKPLDKLNGVMTSRNNLWGFLEETPDRQLKFHVGTTKLDATVIYSIRFGNLPDNIQKKLTPYDKRVTEVVNSLIHEGNSIMSASTIAKAMGIKKPSNDQIQKINNTIEKLNNVDVTIDCTDEKTKFKKYDNLKLQYKGKILPSERMTVYINGVLTKDAIHFFRDCPLLEYAIDKKQITTVGIDVMNFPLQLTDMNILLEDYFLEFVHHNKGRKGGFNRVTYQSIFEKCNVSDKVKRQRARTAISKILKHLKDTKEITGYRLVNSGEAIEINY